MKIRHGFLKEITNTLHRKIISYMMIVKEGEKQIIEGIIIF